jgi:hypothetical protein
MLIFLNSRISSAALLCDSATNDSAIVRRARTLMKITQGREVESGLYLRIRKRGTPLPE